MLQVKFGIYSIKRKLSKSKDSEFLKKHLLEFFRKIHYSQLLKESVHIFKLCFLFHILSEFLVLSSFVKKKKKCQILAKVGFSPVFPQPLIEVWYILRIFHVRKHEIVQKFGLGVP